ncbi:type II secretion system ATPase GspE [Thiolinea disciformis]|uniref:type II secretion system ATPase GspE n=1 Tax=Thiolinea disciformis TaxID=125614 RepID=UPI00035C9C5C|nr:type II secretion system ATPase GspE [Thiolinea disciformis]
MLAAAATPPDQRFGERLVQLGKLKPADLERALRAQHEIHQPLGSVLVRLGLLTEQEVAVVLSRHLRLPLATTRDYPEHALEQVGISLNYMRTAAVVPLRVEGDQLVLAMADPSDRFALQALELAAGKRIKALLGLPSEIRTQIERLYSNTQTKVEEDEFEIANTDHDTDDIEHLKDMASEAPVIRIVNHIMTQAMSRRASDIHVEPFENLLKVRYRIDGVIHEVESPPAAMTAAILSRIKLMARLNIAERRLPQDGRIQLKAQGKEIDMRVSTVPTMHGESVVMRLLDKNSVKLDLNSLGFSPENYERLQRELAQPHGIILVTGPTGSGKTTTLYAALTQLNTAENKILTVEDPVEYELEGINQIQANPKIGLNFADALRSIVRQDPDIIMIGEMRDVETARIAIQSALTGHLVLSTIHTNDAAGGVTRLMDMGIEDYLITSTVNCILAQRLVRRLCPQCRESYPVLPELEAELGLRQYQTEGDLRLWQAKGCSACGFTGYKGRSAIHEVLVMNDALRRLILKHEDAGVIQEQARRNGMRTLYEDGLFKALKGVTTLDEVLRVAEGSPNASV